MAKQRKPLTRAKHPTLPYPNAMQDLLRVVAQSQDDEPVKAIAENHAVLLKTNIATPDLISDALNDLIASCCTDRTLEAAEQNLRYCADQLRHATDAARHFRREIGVR